MEEFAPPYTSYTTVISTSQDYDPLGLSVDAAGNLWMADGLNIIYELTQPGQAGSTYHQKYNAGNYTQGVDGVGALTLPTSVVQGTDVTFTSTVISSPAGASPPGSVTFTDGGTLLGTATLDGGSPDTATFSTATLGVGAHTITATYGGGGGYPASTSELGTVDVYSPTVDVAVSATQTYGGTPTFTATDPASLPPGVTITGTLSGCTTSEDASAAPGTYPSTISGCSGLSLGGANAGSYTLAYVDSGVTVQPLSLTVPVTGTQSYGGTPTFTAGPPASLPTGITGVTGTLSGCATTVGATTVPGSYPTTITGCTGLDPHRPRGGRLRRHLRRRRRHRDAGPDHRHGVGQPALRGHHHVRRPAPGPAAERRHRHRVDVGVREHRHHHHARRELPGLDHRLCRPHPVGSRRRRLRPRLRRWDDHRHRPAPTGHRHRHPDLRRQPHLRVHRRHTPPLRHHRGHVHPLGLRHHRDGGRPRRRPMPGPSRDAPD